MSGFILQDASTTYLLVGIHAGETALIAALSTLLCDVLDFLLCQSEMRTDIWESKIADLGPVGKVARVIIARHVEGRVIFTWWNWVVSVSAKRQLLEIL